MIFHFLNPLTTREGEVHEDEEERPLHHVEHHAAEGDLQRAEVRVDGEDVDELQVGEDVGGGEEALRDQHRVPRVPLVPADGGGARCSEEGEGVRKKERSPLVVRRREPEGDLLLHLVVRDDPEGDRRDVERVREEVDEVPRVVHVLLQTHVPQLLDFTPYQTCSKKKKQWTGTWKLISNYRSISCTYTNTGLGIISETMFC